MGKNIYNRLKIPIIIVELYLVFTIVLYILGPWKWRTNNPIIFYTMILIYHVALALGYMNKLRKKADDNKKSYAPTVYSIKFIKVIIVINLIFVFLNVIRSLNLSSFSLQNFLNQVISGLLNPAIQYRESKEVVTKFGGSILSYANVFFAPLLWMTIPLSLFRFKELTIKFKVISIITIFLEVSRWIGIGTNKGIFDIIFILVSIFIIKKLSIIKEENISSLYKSRKKGGLILIAFVLCIGIYSFSNSIGNRVQSNWTNLSITNGYTEIDFESPLMKICPDFLKPTLVYLGSYLTQGYYALSLATSLEWVPMFGVGNSMFLMENIGSIINVNLYEFTYQTRMGILGWNPLGNWHSFYLWIANDVSLAGVIIIMYFLGKFFASIVYDSIVLGDNIAIVLFCLLAILFFYIPANNQVLSYPTTAMAFWILSIIWLYKKKIRKRK